MIYFITYLDHNVKEESYSWIYINDIYCYLEELPVPKTIQIIIIAPLISKREKTQYTWIHLLQTREAYKESFLSVVDEQDIRLTL